jgi:hypothetical protein
LLGSRDDTWVKIMRALKRVGARAHTTAKAQQCGGSMLSLM